MKSSPNEELIRSWMEAQVGYSFEKQRVLIEEIHSERPFRPLSTAELKAIRRSHFLRRTIKLVLFLSLVLLILGITYLFDKWQLPDIAFELFSVLTCAVGFVFGPLVDDWLEDHFHS